MISGLSIRRRATATADGFRSAAWLPMRSRWPGGCRAVYARNSRPLRRKSRETRVELYPEAVERHRDHVVLADGEDQIHHLLRVVGLCERVPGGIRNHGVLAKFVNGLHQ